MNTTLKIMAVMTSVAVLMCGTLAQAAVITVTEASDSTNYNSVISASDLINSGQPSLAGGGYVSGPILAGNVASLNDGLGQDGVNLTVLWAASPATIYQFDLNTDPNTGGSALGYDITQVDMVAGWWSGSKYSAQAWTILAATVDNPTTYTSLQAVSYAPYSGEGDTYGYTHVKLTDDSGKIATGVSSIRFVSDGANTLPSELDVAGTATADIPEPSMLVLLVMAVGGLLCYAWRRQR